MADPATAPVASTTAGTVVHVIVVSSDDGDGDAGAGAAPLRQRRRRRRASGDGAGVPSQRRRLTGVGNAADADASTGAGAITGAGAGASVDNECAVCFDGPKSHIFVPCGHVCVCKECADSIIASTKQCPICRGDSSTAIQVFL